LLHRDRFVLLESPPLGQDIENVDRAVVVEAGGNMPQSSTLDDRTETLRRGDGDLVASRLERLGQRHHGVEVTKRGLDAEQESQGALSFRAPRYRMARPILVRLPQVVNHRGLAFGRNSARLRAYKMRPADDIPPHKFEAGTRNHEGLAGQTAAINYLTDIGAEFGAPFADEYAGFEGRRLQLKTAMAATRAYERPLAERLISGLQAIPDVTIYGITDPAYFDQRAPTVAFTLKGYTPRQVAERLGEEGIFVWDGNYYALAVTERLGVEESGGMVRVGIAHYNTLGEVERSLAVVSNLARL
jgi:hypothetical protein